jgi:D-amino-acid dehydrogenase
MHIAVLGAGVIGTATAFFLAEAGHRVTVIERADDAGEGTSRANGAIVHPSSVAPWSAPGVPMQALRWMRDPEAPFLLRASAVPHMWRWGIDFIRHCREDRHLAGRAANTRLALETVDALALIRARTGLDWDSAPGAVLKLFTDPAALDAAAAKHAPLRGLGLRIERLDAAAVGARDPALARLGNRIAGALCFPQDEIGDARRFCVRLAEWSARHQPVTYRYGVAIEALDIAGGAVRGVHGSAGTIAADAVVVALGPWSAPLLKRHGIRAPIWPVKGVSVTFPREAWPDAPRVALLSDEFKFAFVPLEDRVRVVGSAEIAGWDATPDPRRIRAMTKRVASLFGDFPLDDPRGEAWAGLRPVTPSGQPIIGPTRIGGLWLNTGHGHTGWTQSAGSARRLAAMIGAAPPDDGR